MKEKETFYTSDRNVWRMWLNENYKKKKEIWFVFPSAESGDDVLSYNDTVEEALCFGWIDSTTGKLDETHSLRRFGPRKDENSYSRINIERLIWLDKNNLLIPEIRENVSSLISEQFEYPEDIIDAIKQDETAWENYQKFSEPYRRIRISHIDSARDRKNEFEKRLNLFIQKTRLNKLIKGFGSSDKYYR